MAGIEKESTYDFIACIDFKFTNFYKFDFSGLKAPSTLFCAVIALFRPCKGCRLNLFTLEN